MLSFFGETTGPVVTCQTTQQREQNQPDKGKTQAGFMRHDYADGFGSGGHG